MYISFACFILNKGFAVTKAGYNVLWTFLFLRLQAEKMIAGVKKAFKNNLPRLGWMDKKTIFFKFKKKKIKKIF